MRHSRLVVVACALALGATSACATKKFVRESVGEVNEKVGSLSKSLEETQERVRQAEVRITEVDQKTAAANQAAGQAQTTANAATSAAGAAADLGRKAEAHTAALEKETRKLIFETVVSEDSGEFTFGRADLPDGAKAAVDNVVARLKAEARNAFVEVEGHTDSAGDEAYNEALGLQRAEAVKRYLYENHQIPLHKINVISFGERKPVAPNNTRDGRAQNRRVVIKILG
ncbi:MAG: OmpA family protein [Vicinamibacterales bacterium]